MQIHNIQRNTKRKYSQSVGRGGKRGKTSGRGTKGQKARAGHKMRPEMREIIMRLPKHRGYRFVSRFSHAAPINLAQLEKHFSAGDIVSPETLAEKGLVVRHGGTLPAVKILSTGEITKKISLKGCTISVQAKAKLEKAGGTIA